MKNFLLIFCLCLCVTNLLAQTQKRFLVGLETAGVFIDYKGVYPDYERTYQFNLRSVPRVGYFILENTLIGIQAEYEFFQQNGQRQYRYFGYGILARHYLNPLAKLLNYRYLNLHYLRLRPFLEANFHRSNRHHFSTFLIEALPTISSSEINVIPGCAIQLCSNFFMEIGLVHRFLLHNPDKKFVFKPRLGFDLQF